jgi:hypothetical protein
VPSVTGDVMLASRKWAAKPMRGRVYVFTP